MTECYDVVIVGAGPVGAALALALDGAGLSFILLEARESAPFTEDFRPLALSYGSRLLFERLGIWDTLAPATPIDQIHISQRGGFGRTSFSAAEGGLPALGYVVPYGGLVAALDAASERARLKVRRGARVTTLAHDASSARVEFATPEGMSECLASLVVVADGSVPGAEDHVRTIDYGQSAVTARVDTEAPHGNIAYERFTPAGPLALLPFDRSFAVVWTMPPEEARLMQTAAPDEFLGRLNERFGDRLGRFTAVAARGAHPLALRIAKNRTWGRAVMIGNAAQTLHPVAGQGLNLGLRDAWELARAIKRHGPRGTRLLEAYQALRRIDRGGGIAFTDALIRIFSNDFLPLALARGVGLTLLDCLPPAKNFVMRRMIFGSRG